jgi:hypothetical protein
MLSPKLFQGFDSAIAAGWSDAAAVVPISVSTLNEKPQVMAKETNPNGLHRKCPAEVGVPTLTVPVVVGWTFTLWPCPARSCSRNSPPNSFERVARLTARQRANICIAVNSDSGMLPWCSRKCQVQTVGDYGVAGVSRNVIQIRA